MQLGDMTRRQFLKAGATVAAAAVLPTSAAQLIKVFAAQLAQDPTGTKHRWVMVIDLALCDGCDGCTEACNTEHHLPPGQEWLKIHKMKSSGGSEYYFPQLCMHCDHAPCVRVCPVGATWSDNDGLVLIDNDRCIGCRFCMAACPYGARVFNWEDPPALPEGLEASPEFPINHKKGTVSKCVFCAHKLHEGRLPVCVEACTREGMKAIWFGDANQDVVTNGDQVARLSDLLARNHGYRYKEERGTGPKVYYLPPRGGV